MIPSLCTIIARNHLGRARGLCKSFLRHHPQGRCYVLIIDGKEDLRQHSNEPFHVILPGELSVSNYEELTFKYSVYELCTAIKPFFLSFLLLKTNLASVLFLDPDILIFNGLNRIYDLFTEYDILLTPHTDRDFPDDGKNPDDSCLLQSGIFNLGFIGIKRTQNTLNFLSWWMSKTKDKCTTDTTTGYFVDQKFIDFATSFFEKVYAIRDPGYNVAYWNLHCRQITCERGQWLCNGRPLYFFHFSGYNPENRDVLSVYQNRFKLADLPEVERLFSLYRETLSENDWDGASRLPYGYNCFSNGEMIDQKTRRFYQKLLAAGKAPDKYPFDAPELKKRAQIDGLIQLTLRTINFLSRVLRIRTSSEPSKIPRGKQKLLRPKSKSRLPESADQFAGQTAE